MDAIKRNEKDEKFVEIIIYFVILIYYPGSYSLTTTKYNNSILFFCLPSSTV